MVINKVIICPICGKKTYLRIQNGGYLNEYPIRINCINCRALLKGTFVMDGVEKQLGLNMFNAEIEECDFEHPSAEKSSLQSYTVRNAEYVAEVSGELPCRCVSEYNGGIPISPYLSTIDKIDSMEERIMRLQYFVNNMSEWQRTKSTAFQLLDDGSIDYIAVALNNRMGEYNYKCDHYLKSLHCLQEVVLEETKYLFVEPQQDNCIHELLNLLATVDKSSIHSFCKEIGGSAELLFSYRKAIEVFSGFMKIYPNVLPAETYMYITDKENANNGIATCSFVDIKNFYQDAYESLLSLIVFPVCFDNITMRGDFQTYDKEYNSVRCRQNSRDVQWYRSLDNGTRINKFNTNEPFQKIISFTGNRYIRNGIGHNNIGFNGVSQIITSYDLKDPNKVTAEISLMEMAIDCIGMAKTAVILSEMILFLLREEYRKDNITTIRHPRFYKNTRPNEKCPCGSSIKYKKCCKTEVDSII